MNRRDPCAPSSASLRSRRHRALPHFEGLEGRALMAVVFNQVGDVLTITGDNLANTITVNDNGTNAANNVTASGGGSNFASNSTVHEVRINGLGGNDIINYRLANLILGSNRRISINSGLGDDRVTVTAGNLNSPLTLITDLGAGADSFAGTSGPITSSAASVTVLGNTGNDSIRYTNNGVIRSDAFGAASLFVRADGSLGDDTINVANQGTAIDGAAVNFFSDAGAGNDRVNFTNRAAVTSRTFGSVGRAASMNMNVAGGLGDDTIALFQGGSLSGATSNLTATGSAGRDQISVSTAGDVSAVAGFAAPAVAMTADGGADNDGVTVRMNGKLQAGNLTARGQGGTGDDRMLYVQAGDIGIATSAVNMDGGAGDDIMTSNHSGKLQSLTSTVLLVMQGGLGADNITSNVNLSAGSSGKVGDAGSTALVDGGAGNDTLNFGVRIGAGSSTAVTAREDGGLGTDTGRHTANVSTSSLATDTVIP
ncbi:MAG: hypothetical protein U0800_20100 [Isosphaeraceae bacterium]